MCEIENCIVCQIEAQAECDAACEQAIVDLRNRRPFPIDPNAPEVQA